MPPAPCPHEVGQLVAVLKDRRNAVAAGAFPVDALAAKQPGLYAWWADETAHDTLCGELSCSIAPLIYSGLAGATRWPSGKRSRTTLQARVGSLHLHGNIRGSTFRRTLAAILRGQLHLKVISDGRMATDGEQKLSAWMAQHLLVAVRPYPDSDALGAMERAILEQLDPPLNLDSRETTPFRARLLELRRGLARPG